MRTSWRFLILHHIYIYRKRNRLDMTWLFAWSMIGYLWVVGFFVWLEMSLEVRPFSSTHLAIQTYVTWDRIGVFLLSQSHRMTEGHNSLLDIVLWLQILGDFREIAFVRTELQALWKRGVLSFCVWCQVLPTLESFGVYTHLCLYYP